MSLPNPQEQPPTRTAEELLPLSDDLLQLAERGIGAFSYDRQQLDIIEKALSRIGFAHLDTGTSTIVGGVSGSKGTLHRHGTDGIIVHQTGRGNGLANFYWPAQDFGDYIPGFIFDPRTDRLLDSRLSVEVNPDQIVIFPTGTWHQFGASPGQTRTSTFETWYPRSKIVPDLFR